MKLFRSIVTDGETTFTTLNAAKNKKELLTIYGGNGTFEQIKDVTKYFPIDVDKLEDSLIFAGYGKGEVSLIKELVQEHNSKQEYSKRSWEI